MKTIYTLLTFCFCINLSAQITNGQINYEMRIDQWRQTCENDNAVFSSDDNEVKVGLVSDANTGGTATWTSGGNGATCTGNNYVRRWQADAPSTVTNSNTLLYFCNGRNNAANVFTINHASWEEDGSPDCDPSGDACQSSGSWIVTFKSGTKTPNRWWANNGTADVSSFVTGQSGDFSAKTAWRYTNGTACGNALNFGTLVSGTNYIHVNSNRAAPAGASTSMGYTNVSGNASSDVFYQFVLTAPAVVTISTAGSNYDTYLRLYNSSICGTQIAFNDDSGGATTSLISTTLCAGTYVIQVEGFSSNTGDINLSVLANNIISNGGIIAGGTSPTCAVADPGVFTSSSDGIGGGALSYQWESSTTNGSSGFANINLETNTTYDPTTISQTTWFRRKLTDVCGIISYSNVIQIIATASVTANLTITSSPNTNVCIGTTVSFTAVPTNEGTTPTYQWKINGANSGTNSANFATANLINSDIVSCEMTSSLTTCLTSTTANSNTVTMSMPNSGSPLSGTESATCIVNGSNWVRFYGSTGLLLGEVNAQGNNLGLVQMNTIVSGPQFMQDCTSPTNPLYHTAYMGRTWIMSSTAYPAGSNFPTNVSVRLPYNNTELIALNNYAVSATTGNPNDNGATLANIMLTKITGTTENGIANSADCASTIRGISLNSGSGTNIQSIANTQYVDFSIGQFSEFFLHKNINNSALPVTLTNFSATCENNVTLSWTTASEQNSDRFIVEKSRDGQTWNMVGEKPAAGNSNTILNYSFIDANSWNATSYYRLRQIDFNGAEEIYGPISVSCKGNESSMTVYPNPNNGSFTIEITSTEMYNDAQLFLTDLTGKVITSQKVNVANGTTQILMDNLDLKMGTYLMTLRGADQQLKPVKVMVVK